MMYRAWPVQLMPVCGIGQGKPVSSRSNETGINAKDLSRLIIARGADP